MLSDIGGDIRSHLVGVVLGVLITGGTWLLRKGRNWALIQRARQAESDAQVAQRIASDTQRMMAFVSMTLFMILAAVCLSLGVVAVWATLTSRLPAWTNVAGGLLLGAALVSFDAARLMGKVNKEIVDRERVRLSGLN